jgi:hypothetical protein
MSEVDDLIKRGTEIDELVIDKHIETQRWLKESIKFLLQRERQREIEAQVKWERRSS